MPRGDRTGPASIGPMTGRAAGYCTGYNMPGYMNPRSGRVSPGGSFWGVGGYAGDSAGRNPYNAAAGRRSVYPAYETYRGRGSGLGFGRGRGSSGRGGSGRGRGRW